MDRNGGSATRSRFPFASALNHLLLAWAQENPTENTRALYKKVHVFYMLWAYCFENLLKALIVTRQPAGDIGGRETLQLPEGLKSPTLKTSPAKLGLSTSSEITPMFLAN
jgi:hypothetical protein